MHTQSPVAWFMFQSLLTGVITHEWDLNPRPAASPVETRLLLWRAKEMKAKMYFFRWEHDGHDKQWCFCVKDGEESCCMQGMLGSEEEQSVLKTFLFCCFIK